MLKLSASMVSRMMEVDGSLNYFRRALTEMVASLKPQLGEDELEKLINNIMDEVNVPKRMAEIYAQYYNADDVMNLIAFFKSATGKRVLKFQTQLMTKVSLNTQLIAAEMMVVALRKISNLNFPTPPQDDDENEEDEEDEGENYT